MIRTTRVLISWLAGDFKGYELMENHDREGNRMMLMQTKPLKPTWNFST